MGSRINRCAYRVPISCISLRTFSNRYRHFGRALCERHIHARYYRSAAILPFDEEGILASERVASIRAARFAHKETPSDNFGDQRRRDDARAMYSTCQNIRLSLEIPLRVYTRSRPRLNYLTSLRGGLIVTHCRALQLYTIVAVVEVLLKIKCASRGSSRYVQHVGLTFFQRDTDTGKCFFFSSSARH